MTSYKVRQVGTAIRGPGCVPGAATVMRARGNDAAGANVLFALRS